MKVAIKILPSGAGLPLPHYATTGAAGADLHAAVAGPVTLAPGARALIPTGLAIAIADGWEGQVRPRSGLALKHGVTVLNAPGTIDSDYRGEVGVILINHGADAFTVQRGDRIAQIVFAKATQVTFFETELDNPSTRSDAGFGSTGGVG